MNHANFAETTLAAAITDTSGTSITVTSGASFPAAPFIISIDTECLEVTSKGTGTDWTVVRGYESSTAATHTNGATIYHDISAAEADSIAAKLALAGGTMSGPINMGNQDISYLKLLKLNGEIDDGNSGTADTIDWNLGTAHKSTLTGNVTLAFAGDTYLVPIMSSNSAPSGVVASGKSQSDAWKAFDRDEATYGGALDADTWVRYDCGAGVTITPSSYKVAFHSTSYQFTAWKVQGSDNGTNWVDMDSVTGANIGATLTTYYIDTPAAYRYWRILPSAATATTYLRSFDLLSGVTNPAAPCFLTLKLVQDATGGRVVTWPSTVKGTPAINLAANSVSNVLLYWDGTYYWVLNGKQFASATDKLIGRSTAGAGELEEIACTAAGRALLDDANAAAQLTTLGAAAKADVDALILGVF